MDTITTILDAQKTPPTLTFSLKTSPLTHISISANILLTGVFLIKLLYLDCETGGLDPKKNPIIQLSGIICTSFNGQQIEREFDFKLRPLPSDVVDPKALEVNGITPEDLTDPNRLEPIDAYKKLKSIFLTYIDRYDKADKFYLVGQNVQFDYSFLLELWKRQGDDYLGSFIHYNKIDLIALSMAMRLSGKMTHTDARPLPNMKLSSLCSYFGLQKQSHDALSDIRQTKEIFEIMTQKIRNSDITL